MKAFPLFLIFIFCSIFSFSQEDSTQAKAKKVQLRGYVKEMQSTSFSALAPGTINDNLLHNRLNFKWFVNDKNLLVAEMRNRIFWGNSVSLTPNYGNFFDKDPGLLDLSFVLVNNNDWSFVSQIDRLYYNWNNEAWEVRVGRQRINWGITSFWNSNDLFNAFTFTDFDYEERPGVDALRIQHYLSGMNSVELAIKPALNDSSWVGGLLYRFNKWQYDFQVLAAWYQQDYALGIGWAGNIKKASFKGEATYFHPQNNFLNSTGALSISTSLDYLFKKNVFGTVGYLYNSIGLSGNFNLANIGMMTIPVSAKSLMPAKHSTLLSVAIPLTPLLSFNIAGVYSPGINLLLAMPSLAYSISNSWEAAVFSQNYWVGSNLDNLGNGIYLRIKYSF